MPRFEPSLRTNQWTVALEIYIRVCTRRWGGRLNCNHSVLVVLWYNICFHTCYTWARELLLNINMFFRVAWRLVVWHIRSEESWRFHKWYAEGKAWAKSRYAIRMSLLWVWVSSMQTCIDYAYRAVSIHQNGKGLRPVQISCRDVIWCPVIQT